MENLSILIASTLLYIKYVHFIMNLKKINKMRKTLCEVIELSYDERFKDRKVIRSVISITIMITKWYFVGFIMTIVLGILKKALTQKLLFMLYYPFDVTTPIGLLISGTHEIATALTGSIMLIAYDGLPTLFISYAIGLLDELAKRLDSIGSTDELSGDELKSCIEIHQKIKQFVEDINDAYGIIFFLQASGSSLNLCTSIFTASMVDNYVAKAQAMILCVPLLIQIFAPCFFGQRLKDSSINISVALFNSKWYNLDEKSRKLVVVFMENLKQPMKIEYRGLIEANLETFTNIMNSAYSFLAVLQNLNNKK
jgi:hypothetical protein